VYISLEGAKKAFSGYYTCAGVEAMTIQSSRTKPTPSCLSQRLVGKRSILSSTWKIRLGRCFCLSCCGRS